MAVHAGRALFEQGIGDRRGNAQRGVLVWVYDKGTTTLSTLYTDRTKATEADNPISTNGLGNLAIFADPGDYEAHVDSTGAVLYFTVLPDWEDVVTGGEPEAGLPAHLADTVDAHDASAISVVAGGELVGANVQAALADLADRVAGAGGTVPDADADTKGKVQLAGDLGGTATAPTVPGLAAKAFLPLPTDHVVYVSKGVSASDANDGLTAYSAKATVQAAADALPGNFSASTGGGRIVVLHGDHTGGLNITTPRTTVEFISEGARLSGEGMASGKAVLRLAASRCRVMGGWVHNVPANGVGVLVTVNETPDPGGSTANTSNQNTNIYGTFVDSLGANAIAFGIGSNTNRDVSETTLVGCSSVGNGSDTTHMRLGSGATGNVLDTTNIGGNCQGHAVGIHIYGGNIISTGLNFQTSAVADILVEASPVGPVTVKGGRSENAFRFIDSTGVQFAAPYAFEDYHVTNLSNTDGKGVKWASETPVKFEGVVLSGNTVPQQFWVRQMQGSPGSDVPAVIQFVNCWSDHPRPFGPLEERSKYLRTVIGGGQVSTASIQPVAGTSANVRRDAAQIQTGAATYTFDAASASTFVAKLDRNCTAVSIINPKLGQVVTLEYVQNGVGSWTYAWPTNLGFAGNAAPSASTAANDSDSITMRWTGSYWREVSRAIAVRPPTLPAQTVTDDFTGTDDFRPLTSTTSAHSWEHLLGVFGRSSNKAAPVILEPSLGFRNQTQTFALAVVEAGRKTGTVQADITYQGGAAGVVFNATDDKNFLYAWFDGSVLRTSCFIDGDNDVVTTQARAHTVGETYTFRVDVTSTGFRVMENGATVVAVADWSTDARYKKLKDGTKFGLYSGGLANRFDGFSIDSTPGGLNVPLAGGVYATAPDSAALSILTPTIDVRARVAVDDWTPGTERIVCSKHSGVGGYIFKVSTAGNLYLDIKGSGGDKTFLSTAAAPFIDGATGWVRAVLSDPGGGNLSVTFHTAVDGASDPSSWTQLGSVVTLAAPADISDNTELLVMGAYTDLGTQPLGGTLYRLVLRNGATVVFDATFPPTFAGTFTESSSNAATVTIVA